MAQLAAALAVAAAAVLGAAVSGGTSAATQQRGRDSRIPQYTMPPAARPHVALPAAGLRLLAGGTTHSTVYAPDHKLCCTTDVPPCARNPACLGSYNHAPLVTLVTTAVHAAAGSARTTEKPEPGVLLIAWHNGPFDEDSPLGRALYSHSADGQTWAPAEVMFDALPGTPPPAPPLTAPPPLPRSPLAAPGGGTAGPFCVLDSASSNFYIKTGGERSVTCGWDGGEAKDKCCRSKPGNCRWLNITACAAALPLAADPASHYCLPCTAGVTDSGCPMGNWTPGPPPPPPVPAVEINGTNLYMAGFVSFGGRQYAVAEGFVGTTSAECRTSEQHGPCGPAAGCCSKGLGCCKCLSRRRLPQLMRRVGLDPTSGALHSRCRNRQSAAPPSRFGRCFNRTGKRVSQLIDSGLRPWLGALALDKPFWASPLANFPWVPQPSYMAQLEEMDAVSQADANELAAKRLLQVVPKALAPRVWSERSITFQASTPTTAQLALLIRDDGTPSSLTMWASLCELSASPAELQRIRTQHANGEFILSDHQCNWSAPVQTNIPDSRSKTCSGTLPPPRSADGGGAVGLRYLLGNQLPKIWDRDPLTISLSKDGVSFDCVLAVRARCVDGQHCPGPGHQFFPGFGKGPGYQYPAAAVVGDSLVITYSIAKEEIGVSRVPLSELVCK